MTYRDEAIEAKCLRLEKEIEELKKKIEILEKDSSNFVSSYNDIVTCVKLTDENKVCLNLKVWDKSLKWDLDPEKCKKLYAGKKVIWKLYASDE